MFQPSHHIKLPPNPFRFVSRWVPALLGLVWGAFSANAQITISNVNVVNVTPGGFSVVWSASSSVSSQLTPSISIFADSGGLTNLAGQVGVEYYPLHTGNPALTNSYDRRLNKTSLRQKTMGQGLVEVRISKCSPNTTYYYQLQEADTKGHQAVSPAAGPLPSATTAVENDFVVQSLQLILDVSGIDPSGSIVLLSNSNTPSLLAAVAGDGVSSNQVYFNLSDLLAASGATNFLPLGPQQFTAVMLGASNSTPQTVEVTFTTDFVVGSGSQAALGSYAVLSIGSAISRAGTAGSLPINLYASAITNLSFVLNFPTNLFSSLSLQSLSAQLGSATLQPMGSNSLLATLSSAPGQTLAGNQQIAQLNFTTFPNQSSAFVPFSPQSLKGNNVDASSVGSLAVQSGRLVIVGNQPLLEQTTGSNHSRALSLYGIPGDSYELQFSTNLAAPGDWTDLKRLPMTNLLYVLTGLSTTNPAIFYRAYQFTATTPILDIEPGAAGSPETLLLYGTPAATYEVDYATGLTPPVVWNVLSKVTLSNSFQFITGLGTTAPEVFYRAIAVVSTPPTLTAQPSSGGHELLLLSGAPWSVYEVDYTTNLGPPTVWKVLSRVALTNSSQLVTGLSTATPDVFYRTTVLNADPPILESHLDNQTRSLLVYGLVGTNYSLQYATNLSPVVTWHPLLSYTLTNPFQTITNIGNTNPVIFYRLKR